jgi:hypothetical protein
MGASDRYREVIKGEERDDGEDFKEHGTLLDVPKDERAMMLRTREQSEQGDANGIDDKANRDGDSYDTDFSEPPRDRKDQQNEDRKAPEKVHRLQPGAPL